MRTDLRDARARPRTVTAMRTVISRTDTTGYFVLARIPEGAAFVARMADTGEERDVTDAACDLVLTAALETLHSGQDEPAPAEQVDVAHLRYQAPLAVGALTDGGSFHIARAGAREAFEVPGEQVLPLLARGVALAITAAVAADIEVPADAADLTEDTDEPQA